MALIRRRPILTALAGAAALAAGTLAAPASPARAGTVATIDGSAAYQRISGFGASEAFGQAATIMSASPATQAQALDLLFSRSRGAGLSMLRNEISADAGSTIEPDAPSSPSAAPAYLPLSAVNSDQGQLWLAQQIRARYGVTDVFADAWSAPAFMKTNDATSNGGALCGVPGAACASGDWRQAYANYLTQYARDYAAAGVPLSYVGPENEANLATSYDSMTLTPAQTANLLDVLGPTVARSGLPTRAECCATEGWDYAAQYAAAIEHDPAARVYDRLFTSHGYTAPPDSPLPGWNGPAWETEWSTFEKWDPAWDDGTDASGLTWAQHILTGLTHANLSASLYWWGSATPTENGDNESLILINGSTISASGRLWAFANFSRFVRPGAVRVAAASPASGVSLTAFRNTDGTVAVVALNTSASTVPMTFTLRGAGMPRSAVATPYLTNTGHDTAAEAPAQVRDSSFTATIPPRSLVTWTITPR